MDEDIELEILSDYVESNCVPITINRLGIPIGSLNIQVNEEGLQVVIFDADENEISDTWYTLSELYGEEYLD